jgi:phosphatidylglycerophosphatase A
MNPDPKEVVIDEVVGQLLTLICTLPFIEKIYLADKSWVESTSPYLLIAIFYPLPFILFRYFDICKPWPINWCDRNIKGGFGIMFDDIVAAFAAIIMFHTIGMILGDYF